MKLIVSFPRKISELEN
jgi:hypothetical protein